MLFRSGGLSADGAPVAAAAGLGAPVAEAAGLGVPLETVATGELPAVLLAEFAEEQAIARTGTATPSMT